MVKIQDLISMIKSDDDVVSSLLTSWGRRFGEPFLKFRCHQHWCYSTALAAASLWLLRRDFVFFSLLLLFFQVSAFFMSRLAPCTMFLLNWYHADINIFLYRKIKPSSRSYVLISALLVLF
jgi:hypothetical protein